MKKILFLIVLFFCTIQQFHAQESQEDGVVALNLPVRNSLKFNQYAVNPTFSFVRSQNKYITFSNKREWVQFDDAPQTYLFSYSGRFSENAGMGAGVFQQNHGVLTTFGGIVNYAYNAVLNNDTNLTFGVNLGVYKSGLNNGKVVTNYPDPSLQNIPSNTVVTIQPGINYGTDFFDFGLSVNNLVSYNFKTSKLIEANPEQAIQAHMMYTGYMNNRGFFDESKFSTLVRSEFKKDKTVISGIAMINVPKGIWAQAGYNTLYGISAGIGLNITSQIAIEYNYEKALGTLSNFGNSHDITLAFKFKNSYRYHYSGEDEEAAFIIPKKKSRRIVAKNSTNTKTKVDRKAIADAKATAREKAVAQAKAKAEARAILVEKAKAKREVDAQPQLAIEKQDKIELEAKEKTKLEQEVKAKADAEIQTKLGAELQMQKEEEAKVKLAQETKAKADAEVKVKLAEETKAKAEEESKIKLATEAKAKAEAKLKLEAAEKLKAETEAKLKLAQEAKAKADAEVKTKLAAETKVKAEEESKIKLATEAKTKAEAEAKSKLEAAEKLKAETDAKLKLAQEAKAKADAEVKAKLAAETKAKAEEKSKIKLATEAKAKGEAEAKSKSEAAEKLKAETDAKLKLAQEAKAKADAEFKAKLAAETKARAEEEAKIKLATEAKAQADAAAKAKIEAAEKLRAETETKLQLAQEAKVKADAEFKAKLVAETKAKVEEAKIQLATEAKAKADAEAKAKIEAAEKLKAEAKSQAMLAEAARVTEEEAQKRVLEKEKAKAETDAQATRLPTDATTKSMQTLTKATENSEKVQQELLRELSETVASKKQDLIDLKEENDLSEQGIFKAPKAFKSVSAENASLESLKLEIDDAIKSQGFRISELETLYKERIIKISNENDAVNASYLQTIQELKSEQLRAIQSKENLVSILEEIKVATEIERKRRIKRAAYDNEQDRYLKDRAALKQLQQLTPESTVPLKETDFDFGEEQSKNIQIVKDVKNTDSGYYLVLAVHSDVAKRDEFLAKAVSLGQTNINFFYDVTTSNYFIYYERFDDIASAERALRSKGNAPYNSKMSMVKIEN